MSAYIAFTRKKTLDQGELDAYAKEAQATVAGHEVKILASYGSHEDLEGARTEDRVVLEFPSMAVAKAWYDSPLRP